MLMIGTGELTVTSSP